MQQLVTKKKVM